MMRLGWYRAVHVKNINMQKMRSLLANRKLLKRKLIDTEKSHSWHGASVWLADRSRWSRELRSTRPGAPRAQRFNFSVMIEIMLDARRAIFEGYERLHCVLRQVVQQDAVCSRLMTVPDVGPVAGLSFKVGVDEGSRGEAQPAARSRPRTAVCQRQGSGRASALSRTGRRDEGW
jgi:hypothetical protein